MLSIFPVLFAFKLIAPFILRVAVGLTFLGFGWTKIKKQKESKTVFFESIGLRPGIYYVWIFGVLEIIIGLALLVGFLTQIAAILAALILITALWLQKKHPESFGSSSCVFWLLLVISISLLFSGAGFIAFDLPL